MTEIPDKGGQSILTDWDFSCLSLSVAGLLFGDLDLSVNHHHAQPLHASHAAETVNIHLSHLHSLMIFVTCWFLTFHFCPESG